MNTEKRRKEIIKILSRDNSVITAQELALILNVSIRTIHYDLQIIEKELKTDFCILKRPGIGIQLLSTEFNNQLKEKVYDLDISSSENGLVYASVVDLFKELISNDKISLEKFENKYYWSESTILDALKHLRNLCSKDEYINIEYKNYNFSIKSNEFLIQRWMNKFCCERIKAHSNVKLKLAYHNIKDLFGDNVLGIYRKIEDNIDEFNLKAPSAYYRLNFLNQFCIFTYRLLMDKHIVMEQNDIFDSVSIFNYYLPASEILRAVQGVDDFKYTEGDVYYLAFLLYVNRIDLLNEDQIFNKGIGKIAYRMVDNLSKATNENLLENVDLLKNLTIHLDRMVTRVRNCIHLVNPFLQDIMSEYRAMYDLVWMIVDSEKKNLGVSLSEDEIGFLFLHFQVAFDNKRKSHFICVIQEGELIPKDFVNNRIQKVISFCDRVKIVTPLEFEKINKQNIDMLVSSVIPYKFNKKVTYISPLISEKDLKILAEDYHNMIIKENEANENEFLNYISSELIFINDKNWTKEEALLFMTRQLQDRFYVTDNYYETVMYREGKGDTSIECDGTFIAIAHGSMSFVNKTYIPILFNKKAIPWGGIKVNIIFLYAISENDLSKSGAIISGLINFINKNARILQEKNLWNKEGILNIIKKFKVN